ncbi:MAG TPA: DUF445 domain-containing protein [Mycobacteriales bacterium]
MTPATSGAAVVQAGRVRRLRRMKAGATALLLVAAALYVLTLEVHGGSRGAWGYLRAASEAGMVGGLADWFAVTALFRRPLGLPIPHTAIIPTRKDDIGRSLEDFVGTNFLSEAVVRERVASAGAPARLGGWLADPAHAARVADETAVAVAAALRVLRDEDVQAVLGRAALSRLTAVSLGPWTGQLAEPLLADGVHHRLVDVAVSRLAAWLRQDAEHVVDVIARQAPGWAPGFLDRPVARRVHAELLRVAEDVASDPDHRLRHTLDDFLLRLARDLQEDPATIARLDALVASVSAREDVHAAVGEAVAGARRLLVELVENPGGELRGRVARALADLGVRLQQDRTLRSKLDAWLADAAAYVVTHYRSELTTVIGDTVGRWDGRETARRVELQVGRDLQFIRVNGTLVGALAGIVIHALSALA